MSAKLETRNAKLPNRHYDPRSAIRDSGGASQIRVSRFTLRDSGGFTLLELIIVLALMALIMGLSTVYFAGSLPSSRLTAVVRELSALVRYGESLAMSSGETQTVFIDLDSRSYGMERKGFKFLPPGIQVTVADPFYGQITRGRYLVRLLPAGGIEGGTVTLQQGRRKISLLMDPVVGVVTVKQ